MKKEFVAIFIAFLLASCGGSAQTRRRIAKNHYKQAATEMRIFYEKNDIHALRKSLNEIDKALELHPIPQTFGLKGTILLQLGELKESLPCFERVFNNKKVAKSKQSDARNNYATALYQLGRVDEARSIWLNIVNNPHYISPEVAYFNLGFMELNEALKVANKQDNPEKPKSTQENINAYLEQSAMYFKQAIAISKDYIDAIFFLGRTLIALNRLKEAKDCYMSILIINPNHEAAQSFLNHVEKKMATNDA